MYLTWPLRWVGPAGNLRHAKGGWVTRVTCRRRDEPRPRSLPERSVGLGCQATSLEREAAVHEVGNPGRERALVTGEVDGDGRDFLRRSEPPEWLAGDEQRARVAAELLDPPLERWRLDRAGADAVAAYALRDEVERHRSGQRHDGALGRRVDVAVGRQTRPRTLARYQPRGRDECALPIEPSCHEI